MANCSTTKYMANDDFSEPPRRTDSKNSIFIFFSDFWVWVTCEAQGSVSVGFWGSRQLSPFWGGGSSQGALSTPPPKLKARLPNPLQRVGSGCMVPGKMGRTQTAFPSQSSAGAGPGWLVRPGDGLRRRTSSQWAPSANVLPTC